MGFARSALHMAWLGGVASAALTLGAAAKDLPADAAGVKTIADFLVTYGGKALASAPGLSITPDGTGYLVALDLAALNSAAKGLGVTEFQAENKLKEDFKGKIEKTFSKWLENLVN